MPSQTVHVRSADELHHCLGQDFDASAEGLGHLIGYKTDFELYLYLNLRDENLNQSAVKDDDDMEISETLS